MGYMIAYALSPLQVVYFFAALAKPSTCFTDGPFSQVLFSVATLREVRLKIFWFHAVTLRRPFLLKEYAPSRHPVRQSRRSTGGSSKKAGPGQDSGLLVGW